MERNSVADILKVISDNKSLDIFCSIAKGSVSSESLKLTKGLTKKQYYIRTKLLLRVGVVQRIKGNFSLTNFGAVVYHSQLIIEAGLNNFWKLKAIDSIQSSGLISEEERLKLVRTILNDNTIESILVKRTA
jgi:hypothetical protein